MAAIARIHTGLDGMHAYIYGRWVNQYVGALRNWILPRSIPEGKTRLADHYQAKVLTHEQATAIIPYPTARNLVLAGPPDVVAFECACRHSSATPCRPAQVCMVIGRPLTYFILEHRPDTSRRLTQAEALELLRAEHERGHVHSAWFKDVMLNRFYAICKCCCVGMEARSAWDAASASVSVRCRQRH